MREPVRTVATSALLALFLLLAPQAKAGEPRALWIATSLPPEVERPLRDACARSLALPMLDARAASDELTETASASAGAARAAVDREISEARRAFLQLELKRAIATFTRALQTALADERAAAPPVLIARILFERSIALTAAKRTGEARRDLAAALTIDPLLDPSPDEYGPPIIRAVEQARRDLARAKKLTLVLARAPQDALVKVNGVPAAPEGIVHLQGTGPHVVTAERPGYRPYAELIELSPRAETRRAIVLERASGELLARQMLETWRARGSLGSDISDISEDVARVLKIDRVLSAARDGDGIALTLVEVGSGRVLRSVRGGRQGWEPAPYAALAESLAGRTLMPPVLTMTLSAPSTAEPAEMVPLSISVVDSARRLRALVASCESQRAELEVDRTAASYVSAMAVPAPESGELMRCFVVGLDERAREVVRAPARGDVEIAIREVPASPWYGRWYVIGGIGAAAAAAVVTGLVLSREEPPAREVVVIHGPQ